MHLEPACTHARVYVSAARDNFIPTGSHGREREDAHRRPLAQLAIAIDVSACVQNTCSAALFASILTRYDNSVTRLNILKSIAKNTCTTVDSL